jgi:hypothetical protein
MPKRTPVTLIVGLVLAGCAHPPARLPVEPLVTFAAHRDGDRFVLDRMRTGTTGVLDPPGRFRADNAPDFVFRADDATRAALWVVGRSRVLVRDDASTISRRRGEVISDWEGGAIRLTLFAPDGAVLRTDPFVARDGRPLARAASTARGMPVDDAFRAVLRDKQGAEVGWLRVRSPRVYDAVLPAAVDDALAVAAAVALDVEVAWITDHDDAGESGSEKEE